MRGQNRGPWFLFTGLILGLVIGLAVSRLALPVKYVDAVPAALLPADQENYRRLVALAYQADGDLGRARARLAQLNDSDPVRALNDQAVVGGNSPQEAGALAKLAEALANAPAAAQEQPTAAPRATRTLAAETPGITATPTLEEGGDAVRTATPEPSATPTPRASFTPRPTLALPTVGAPFSVKGRERVCDPAQPAGLLQVWVENAAGEPAAGVRVTVTWDGGEDSFYTGLYPNISSGYADFAMSAGVSYSLRVGDGGETAGDLSAPTCTAQGKSFNGGWKITFSQ